MANELDSIGNFSIQDTMEMGMGNPQLINDLFTDEASASPESITPIISETTPPAAAAKPVVPAGKEIVPPKSVDGLTDEEKADGQSLISNFLGDGDDDDEEEEEEIVSGKAKPTLPKEETEEESTEFTALSNDLFRLGVFTKEEGEEDIVIKSPQDFLDRFQNEKKKGAIEIVDNFIGQFGEDYQEAFDAIFVKGVNPKDYFTVYNNVVSFAELDLSLESNQEKVVKQALLDQGFDPEDVESEIERFKNYGDLETVATKHHKVLVKKEASKLQEMEEQAEQALQIKAAQKNKYVANVQSIIQDKLKNKEFDGIPINPKLAGELQDFLIVDKWKTPSGENLTDFDRAILDMKRPENHEMKVKVALLLKILEKDPTLSTIQKTGLTKKSDQLFTEVARQVTKQKTGSTPAKTNSWFQ